MSLNYTSIKNWKRKKKRKLMKLVLTRVDLDDFSVEKNKIQIRELDEGGEEFFSDAEVVSFKGEINLTFEFK